MVNRNSITMSLPEEHEYVEYNRLTAESQMCWVEFMLGRLTARHVPSWPKEPQRTPDPLPYYVWQVKPVGVPDNLPVELHVWYKDIITICGHEFHKGTGRSTSGKNASRHGRLNWQASKAAAEAWGLEDRKQQAQVQERCKEILNNWYAVSLAQIPSVDLVVPQGTAEHYWNIKMCQYHVGGTTTNPEYVVGRALNRPVGVPDIFFHTGGSKNTVRKALAAYGEFPPDTIKILCQLASEKWGPESAG